LHGIAETIKKICFPLKILKVNTDEIKVMICISLSMIPILKKDLYDIKEACIAKKIKFNVKNMKSILTKFFLKLLVRVNEIEESLKAKGYSNE
jgi:energy-coupling factor transporter transmembrane protein EcfT